MTALFVAHSALRYLILLGGVGTALVLLLGQLGKQPFGKVHRIATTAYAGTLHLQVLVGLGVLMTRPYYPALIGHIVMMLLAAVVMQVCASLNRRRKPEPGFTLPLAGAVVSLVCIVGGVMSIGRGLLTMTAG